MPDWGGEINLGLVRLTESSSSLQPRRMSAMRKLPSVGASRWPAAGAQEIMLQAMNFGWYAESNSCHSLNLCLPQDLP